LVWVFEKLLYLMRAKFRNVRDIAFIIRRQQYKSHYMDRFEDMKSSTIQFTIEMIKLRLSDAVLEEMAKVEINLRKADILNVDIDNKERIKHLKVFLEENKKQLKGGLYDSCIEEYREIKDDYKFRTSKDGRLIIKIEEWVQKARKKAEHMDKRVFVGRSFIDPKKLVIGGILKNEVDESEMINLFELNNPPVQPEYRFEKE